MSTNGKTVNCKEAEVVIDAVLRATTSHIEAFGQSLQVRRALELLMEDFKELKTLVALGKIGEIDAAHHLSALGVCI